MNSFYGYNIHSRGLKKPTALIEHTMKVKPKWSLVMDGLPLLQQLQTASASTNFIHRNYTVTGGDDDVFKRLSPKQWLKDHAEEVRAGIWTTTTCEPGWSQEVIDWHVELMRLAIPAKAKLVIGNWSVGTPDPDAIRMAKQMLQLCADHPELFVLGLHEYAGAVITSGLVGGAPDGWTEKHDKQYHPDYQKQASWPMNGEARVLTHWHCGRFKFWLDYCRDAGISAPRIVLTEVGFDDVADIGWWTASLPHTAPYKNIAGYKTLQAYWKQTFPQWSHDQAYFKQLEHAENNTYADTPVEGACIYNYGHDDPKWEPDDVEGRTEFLGYMEAHAMPVQPTYTPDTFTSGDEYRISTPGAFINVHPVPNITSGSIVKVPNDAVVKVLQESKEQGDYFRYIEYAGATGWIAMQNGGVKFAPYIPPPDPKPAPVPPVLPRSISVNDTQEKQLRDIINGLRSDAAAVLKSAQEDAEAKLAKAKFFEDLLALPRGA
jgi:hypothetical protein